MDNGDKKLIAKRAVESILAHLQGLSGFDGWWDDIDDEIQEEIERELQKIILKEINLRN